MTKSRGSRHNLGLGIDPIKEGAKQISKVKVSTTKGNLIKAELPLGDFLGF